MSRKMNIIVNADLADVVKAKRSMEAVWAIMMALAQTERPYLKTFWIEVLTEAFHDVDAGLNASHKYFLDLVVDNGDKS